MSEEIKDGDEDGENEEFGLIDCNIYQAATLNKYLPPGFKIESEDVVQRNLVAATKKPKPKKKVISIQIILVIATIQSWKETK